MEFCDFLCALIFGSLSGVLGALVERKLYSEYKFRKKLKSLKNDPVFMAKMDAELQEYCRQHNLEPIDINKIKKAGESDDN